MLPALTKIVEAGTSILKEPLVVCISVDDESLHFEKIYLVRFEMCFNGSVPVWGPALLVKVNFYKLVINVEMWSFT